MMTEFSTGNLLYCFVNLLVAVLLDSDFGVPLDEASLTLTVLANDDVGVMLALGEYTLLDSGMVFDYI